MAEHVSSSLCTLRAARLEGSLDEATLVEGAGFKLPDGSVTQGLPPFVRAACTLRPAAASDIRCELWLPAKGWNGRFLGTGNGGGAGGIAYGALISALKMGFACANTDMGTSPSADKAVWQSERWVNFGHRATHLMTQSALYLTQLFYAEAPVKRYFYGSSTGGQQALSLAQRHPEDYDGILAGVPANNRTNLHALFLYCHQLLSGEGARRLGDPAFLQALCAAEIDQLREGDCGAPQDGFLTDPRGLAPDFSMLDVPGWDRLNKAEISVLSALAAGPLCPRTGERIYAPVPPGSACFPPGYAVYQGWASLFGLLYPFFWHRSSYIKTDAVFSREALLRFDFDADFERYSAQLAPVLNANDPDLSAFERRGGKLIMLSGTSDAIVPYQDAAAYYERVAAACGGPARTRRFFRYFLLPGKDHGSSGPGINCYDAAVDGLVPDDAAHGFFRALMAWVEEGTAPDMLIGTSLERQGHAPRIRFQRPVYPYPLFPQYAGGDPALPSSFTPSDRGLGKVPVCAERFL